MSAYHKFYSTTDDLLLMWNIWTHLTHASNNAVEIVNDGVRDAVWIDPNETDLQGGIGLFSTGNTFQTHAGLADTVVKVATAETQTADWLNSYTITITSGLHNAETATITDYSGSTELVTVASWATKALSGNHTINATVNVVGDGSALYTTELAVGDLITINAEQKEVASITDFQTMTVTAAFAGSATTTGTLDHPSSSTTYNLRSYGSYTTPTKKEAFVRGSFIVIQPAFANPSEITGTAQAGAVTDITLAVVDLEADDYYNGYSIAITSGTGSGQSRFITDYVNSTNKASVSVNFSPAPDATSVYSVTRRWQCKIRRVPTTDFFESEGSPNGGFTMASASSGDTDDFGTNPTTGMLEWMQTAITLADRLYVSTDDSDTYSAGAEKYGYLRLLFRDASSTTLSYCFYVGGYIPFDTVNDTDPFVLLSERPYMGTHTTTFSWGYTTANASNSNRVALENGRASSSLVSAGYAYLAEGSSIIKDKAPITRAGGSVVLPLYVHQVVGECLGYLGPNTMGSGTIKRPPWSTNDAGTMMSIEDITISWS